MSTAFGQRCPSCGVFSDTTDWTYDRNAELLCPGCIRDGRLLQVRTAVAAAAGIATALLAVPAHLTLSLLFAFAASSPQMPPLVYVLAPLVTLLVPGAMAVCGIWIVARAHRQSVGSDDAGPSAPAVPDAPEAVVVVTTEVVRSAGHGPVHSTPIVPGASTPETSEIARDNLEDDDVRHVREVVLAITLGVLAGSAILVGVIVPSDVRASAFALGLCCAVPIGLPTIGLALTRATTRSWSY